MRFVLTIFAALALATPPVASQSLSPTRDEIVTYTDNFVLRLFTRNPYGETQVFTAFTEGVNAEIYNLQVFPQKFFAPPGEPISFIVTGNYFGENPLLVCVRSEPISTGRGTSVRGEVCGKYIIRQQ